MIPAGTPPTRPELAARLLAGGARVGAASLDELRPLVDERLAALRGVGAGNGAVVAVQEAGAEDFVAAILAIWSMDAVPLPCREISEIPMVEQVITLVGRQAGPPARAGRIDGLRHTAVLHLTSGSTGARRLARRGCASVLNEATGYRIGLALSPADRVYVPVPLAHSYGWGIALAALLAGCQLDATPVVHARRAARRLRSATVAAITAPVAGLLASIPDLAAPASAGPSSAGFSAAGPRVAMVGASRVTGQLDDAFAARFGLRLARNYGSSETGATLMGPAGLPEGVVGGPMHGVTVLGPEPGGEGELRLGLPPVEGLLDCPEPARSIWNTGDLVRRGEDGVVTFVARLHQTMRVNDRAVDAERLEAVLRSIPGVDDVFLLTMPRPGGEVDDLYAVLAGAGTDPDQAEERRSEFPDGARSVRLVYTDRLPVSAIGKVDRARLAELVQAEWSRR